jgi:catechol 2,3-dioxygenase-like lactoylglutathione lyase family enzyme
MDIQFQSSVLFVRSIEASRQFYEGLLGQEVAMDFGPNVGFVGGFAIWQVNHAYQMVFGRVASAKDPLGRHNCELYFETTDLDAVSCRLAQGGVTLVHPLREQPWGQRVLRVADPDGHVVEIGEPMPVVVRRYLAQGMTPQDTAQSTSMPLEIVQAIADDMGADA